MNRPLVMVVCLAALGGSVAMGQASFRVQPGPQPAANARQSPDPKRPAHDAKGNPLQYAVTGHVSNYDEAKVGNYTLPDPLVLADGRRVTDADTWFRERRPEILNLYETEIYGRVPERAPAVSFEVVSTQGNAFDGTVVRKHIVARVGRRAHAPRMNIVLVVPPRTTPVPVLLHLVFLGGLQAPGVTAPSHPTPGNTPRFHEVAFVADILARGYGYATLCYTDVEGDRAETSLTGVRRVALAEGEGEPAADEWGTIAAWAWGASRVLDYLQTEPAIDAGRVGLVGHSRLGKTVLWAGARDPRFALIFSSCSGEMGAALARRDYGESVDDMALNFPWQFAGNFQKYIGRWKELPVDSHLLIALAAPRPVFITGGARDQWADPRGQFLAAVAAGPVYRLLGKTGLETDQLPALDVPLTAGDLGFLYHSGGHSILAGDWKAFLDFADRHLHPER